MANRLNIENRLLIRRLVFERLLYSEINAFEQLHNTLDIEYRISADISQTLNFFSFTIPQMISSVYALAREGIELYQMKHLVDPLALLHPILVAIFRKCVSSVKYHFIVKKERDVIHKTRAKMSRLVSNALDGLSDIQVNNLQQMQLVELDKMIGEELEHSLGFKSLVARTWNLFSNRNVLEFVAELYVVHQVMERKQLSHEQYGKIQHDINRLMLLTKRMYSLIKYTRNMLEFQNEVVELVNIPNFLDEQKELPMKIEFQTLELKNIQFSYKEDIPPALDFYGTLEFSVGKIYGVVGRNQSGKSTLSKLICKLYTQQLGEISLNGIPYEKISRVELRNSISYLSQKPFIFPGTIRDNIRVGYPDATEEEIKEAAEKAGVFVYGLGNTKNEYTGKRSGSIRRSKSMNDIKSHSKRTHKISLDDLDIGSNSLSLSPELRLKSSLKSKDRDPLTRKRRVSFLLKEEPPARPEINRQKTPPITRKGKDRMLEQDDEDNNVSRGFLNNLGSFIWEDEDQSYYAWKKRKKMRKKNKQKCKIDEEKERIDTFYDETNLLDMKLTARGGNISGGFAQSIALARVFVRTKAKIIILDEALGQMDLFKKRTIILPSLVQLVNTRNICLIIVSHDLRSLSTLADKIYVLHMGELVHSGSHESLMQEQACHYLQLFGKP